MSVNLSSNFNISAQLPLDSRAVKANTTARDAITSIQRYEGMEVFCIDTNKKYRLVDGITDSDWKELGDQVVYATGSVILPSNPSLAFMAVSIYVGSSGNVEGAISHTVNTSMNISAADGNVTTTNGRNILIEAGDGYITGDTNGGNVYIKRGIKNGAGINGNIYLGTGASCHLDTDDAETYLVAIDSTSGLLTKRAVSTITGTTPTDDILDWSTNKYTPYSDTAKADGQFYRYTSVVPTGNIILCYDGPLWATGFRAGSATQYGSFVGGELEMVYQSSIIRVAIKPDTPDVGTNVPFIFDSDIALTTGRKLMSVRNQGTEKFYIDYNGDAYANGVKLGAGGTTPVDSTLLDWSTDRYQPYAAASAGAFDSSTTNPTGTVRLNYGGYFYATRIYANGSLGINLGNNNPNAPFHVYNSTGVAGGSETAYITSADSLNAGYGPMIILGVNTATTTKLAAIRGAYENTADANYGRLDFYTRTSTALGLEIKMSIRANGRILLGDQTTNPYARVHTASTDQVSTPTLGSSAGVGLAVSSGANTAYGITMGTTSTGRGWIQAMRLDGTATAYDLLLQPSGGNVGIGTTSPSGKFHVYLSANSGFYTFDNTDGVILTNPNNTIGLSTASVGNYSSGANEVWYKQIGGASGSHNFGTNGTSRLYIKADGNVGINNTNPTEKLIVNGRIFANTYPDNCFVLNSAGANYGFIGTDAANEWWLGYGTNPATIGSKSLKWNSSGNVSVIGNLGVSSAASGSYNLYISGTIYSTGNFYGNSDIRRKRILYDEPSVWERGYGDLSIIRFIYNHEKEENVGYSAQNLQKYFPNCVGVDAEGWLAIKHLPMIALNTKAIQEVKSELDIAKERIEQLEKRVFELENAA